MNVTFITGNQNKADYLAKNLGVTIDHVKLDLDELQSLDSRVIVEHKVKQAYGIIKKPVLVEDVSLKFHDLGNLPGPFIKWFIEEIGNEKICKLLTAENDRAATASICYGYYDGQNLYFFEGSMAGSIAETPRGDMGFGWDQIFIKEGMTQTRAELDRETEQKTSMRTQAFKKLREFLKTIES